MDDGVRTHDHRNHNPGLYQLSYAHHYNTTYTLYSLYPDDVGTPCRIRTRDLRLRRPLLYPTELRAHVTAVNNGRGREIRTPDILLPKQARYQTALYPEYLQQLRCGLVRIILIKKIVVKLLRCFLINIASIRHETHLNCPNREKNLVRKLVKGEAE